MVATPLLVIFVGVVMGSRLSPLEREQIGLGRAAGESLGSIARRLGRSVSTISREVGRFERYGQRYQPLMAQWASFLRHNRSGRVPRLAVVGPLRGGAGYARRRRSPQQISARLRAQFPDMPEMWVSHETIYQAIYLQARGNLRAELTRQVALRSGRAARRRRPASAGAVRSARPWVDLRIADRPAEVADRAVPGHWEGDLLEGVRRGGRGGSAIATLVERATRFVILVGLPEGKVSDHVVSQLAAAMTWLPQRLRASLTWDQGVEMARHVTSPSPPTARSTSATRTAPGNAAATKTPTGCCASTSPRQIRLHHHRPGRPRPRRRRTQRPPPHDPGLGHPQVRR